ncbi:TRASH domain-containing protein [Sphingobacterium sp. E70]|uniref:TRASH domain-containing protein n=1 Tax=Sphingobacterium sp. E70 TaxID=2853439 RepID=UPI00211C0F87|nr:TRASH domain-containing protein [Sphingobacterium sp. E70]ULT27157.1 TRASH domain-containing protein [Sphingobacterium sp. E70]
MKYLVAIIAVFVLTLTACTNPQSNSKAALKSPEKDTTMQVTAAAKQYKKGDLVPTEDVCMVNDAFMAKKQLLVKHEGRAYYGCCEMCKNESLKKPLFVLLLIPCPRKRLIKPMQLLP